MKKYLLILSLILLLSLNLHGTEKNIRIDFLLPISLRTDTIYGPDPFVDKMQGLSYYGIGAVFLAQKNPFTLFLKANYKTRKEKPLPKREGKVENNILEFEAEFTVNIWKPIIVSVKQEIFKEKYCPFYYIPRSMFFSSYIPITSYYSEYNTSIKLGLMIKAYKETYFTIGVLADFLKRKNQLEGGFISALYKKFQRESFLTGTFFSIKVNKVPYLPFSFLADIQYCQTSNNKEELFKISGQFITRLIKSIYLVVELSRNSNLARKSNNFETKLRMYL